MRQMPHQNSKCHVLLTVLTENIPAGGSYCTTKLLDAQILNLSIRRVYSIQEQDVQFK